jgi:hypothetical protein
MIDHIAPRVENIDETMMFYTKALFPIGYRCILDETESSIPGSRRTRR